MKNTLSKQQDDAKQNADAPQKEVGGTATPNPGGPLIIEDALTATGMLRPGLSIQLEDPDLELLNIENVNKNTDKAGEAVGAVQGAPAEQAPAQKTPDTQPQAPSEVSLSEEAPAEFKLESSSRKVSEEPESIPDPKLDSLLETKDETGVAPAKASSSAALSDALSEVLNAAKVDVAPEASRVLPSEEARSFEIKVPPQGVETPQNTEPADAAILQDMPYLLDRSKDKPKEPSQEAAILYTQPLGDAVIPGGVAQSPDVETLKKYLMLREQDVVVLSNQMKAFQDQVRQMEKTLREEKGRLLELEHLEKEQRQKIEQAEAEKKAMQERYEEQLKELEFQMKTKVDQARVYESQTKEANEQMEKLKERVRIDIRKIRIREKELENRLEILKKDSEVLISARENKIVELKRKLDLLEFNMDLLQEQYARERENSEKLKERLAKAAHASKIAMGLLDT